MTNEVIEGGQSFAEQCVVIKWLEEAGVDFFDISGGTYESPAWRGNIMTELAERPSQKQRGRYVLTSSLIPLIVRHLVGILTVRSQLLHRVGAGDEEGSGMFTSLP